MGFEHEKRTGQERRHTDPAPSPEAQRKSGEAQGVPRHFDDMDPAGTKSREESFNAMRRRAQRRQSSALIALWVDVERRSGEDQRTSPSGNDIDEARR